MHPLSCFAPRIRLPVFTSIIWQMANEVLSEPVIVVECEDSLPELDAVEVAMRCLPDVVGAVAVIPANMPLLDPLTTLLSMEAMLADQHPLNKQVNCVSECISSRHYHMCQGFI